MPTRLILEGNVLQFIGRQSVLVAVLWSHMIPLLLVGPPWQFWRHQMSSILILVLPWLGFSYHQMINCNFLRIQWLLDRTFCQQHINYRLVLVLMCVMFYTEKMYCLSMVPLRLICMVLLQACVIMYICNFIVPWNSKLWWPVVWLLRINAHELGLLELVRLCIGSLWSMCAWLDAALGLWIRPAVCRSPGWY